MFKTTEEVCQVACSNGKCTESTESKYSITGSISMEVYIGQVYDGDISFSDKKEMPLPFATILVVKDDKVIAAGESDIDGKFSVGMDTKPTGAESVIIMLIQFEDDKAVLSIVAPHVDENGEVDDILPWGWKFQLNGSTNLGKKIITDGQGSGAGFLYLFNYFALNHIIDLVPITSASSIEPLAVIWYPGIAWKCGACFTPYDVDLGGNGLFEYSILIGGEDDSASAWGYPVILHEFGHYAARFYSRDNSTGGPHSLGVPISPPFAWSEGWATWFAVATFSSLVGEAWPQYWDVQGGSGFWLDLATANISEGGVFVQPDQNGSMMQYLDENWVAMMIWDLWDGGDIPEIYEPDGSTLGTAKIYKAVTSARFLNGDRGAAGADFVDFVDSVICLYPSLKDSIVGTIVGYLGFPYDGNNKCN